MNDHEQEVRSVVDALTLPEKVSMLSGSLEFHSGMRGLLKEDLYHREPFRAVVNERLGVEGLAFIDGPRGVVIEGGATCFPVSMARGASWNPELERQIGEVIARELRALGGNLFGGVCINLLRHPAWGRAQETYGEDPLHIGSMGAALTEGVEQHAMACVKHFALNSIENARFSVDVTISGRALHEVYLPHFKRCVEAGASCVMSAYNAVNGQWSGQSRQLLTDILRDRWGFEGYVITDWIFGVRDARAAIENGLDLEMPFPMVWGENLLRLVRRGEVSEERLDRALARLLAPLFKVPDKGNYERSLVGAPEHRSLARESAVQSIVLLKNQGRLLPLKTDQSIVVVGELADRPNLGDRGSSDGRPRYVVTPLEGLKRAFGDTMTYVARIETDADRQAIESADAVIVVAGYTYKDEGEHIVPPDLQQFAHLIPPLPGTEWLFRLPGLRQVWTAIVKGIVKRRERQGASPGSGFHLGGDRPSLALPQAEEAMIRDVCALNDNAVVAVMGGSAVMMNNWEDEARAILMLWYPGMEGGNALADILTGSRSPGGKLPFVIPKSEADLPFFDKDAKEIEYDLWHGHRKLARDGRAPAYPFGFGLGYTVFALSDLDCRLVPDTPKERIEVSLTLENQGEVDGAEVVQIYVGCPESKVERAPVELKGFQRVELRAGESERLMIAISRDSLAYYDETKQDFVVEPGSYTVIASRYCGDPAGLSQTIRVS